MFEGFESIEVEVGEASVFARYGGEEPPVLLLHGHPRTSATWHKVAPLLVSQGFQLFARISADMAVHGSVSATISGGTDDIGILRV